MRIRLHNTSARSVVASLALVLCLTFSSLPALNSVIQTTPDHRPMSVFKSSQLNADADHRGSGRLTFDLAYRGSGRISNVVAHRGSGRLLAYRGSGRLTQQTA